MPFIGCSALYGVNPNLKSVEEIKQYFTEIG